MTQENRLYSPKRIKQVMAAHGLRFNKNLGQNFLIDGNLVRKIADAAELSDRDTVIEIGPGIGTLTEEILLRSKKVIAVEIDNQLIPVLQKQFADRDNFILVHEDAMKVDFRQLIEDHAEGGPVKIVANLPYYITTPILSRLLTEGYPITCCTVMVQQEVADRIMARPSTKEYGSLTLFVQCFARANLVVRAPKEVFMPQPKVDSTVVKLDFLASPPVEKVAVLTNLIQVAFQQRRKTILNSLAVVAGQDKKVLSAILSDLSIPATARPENLSLDDFIAISKSLFNLEDEG